MGILRNAKMRNGKLRNENAKILCEIPVNCETKCEIYFSKYFCKYVRVFTDFKDIIKQT